MRVPKGRRVILGVVGLAILLGGLFFWTRPSSPIVQPISFNHKAHPLGCEFCHKSVQRLAVAGRPALATCAACHQSLPPRTEAMKALKGYIDRGQEVPWKRIYQVPDNVYFSHQRHVATGKLKCETCHGEVSKFTQPAPRPVVEPSMDNCIGCHSRNKVSVDCNACHR